MKKIVWKRFVAGMMAAAMLLTMAGCEKKGDKQNNQANEVTNEMVYEGTKLAIDGMTGNPSACIVKNGTLYIKTSEEIEKEDASKESAEVKEDEAHTVGGSSINRLYSANIDGSNVQEIKLNLSEETFFDQFFVKEDGTLICVLYSNARKPEQFRGELVKVGADGSELFREDITKSLNLGEKSHINSIVADEKGTVIVVSDQRMYILDENFKFISEVDLKDKYVSGAALTKDGQIICTEDDYTAEMSSAQVQVLDIKRKKWEKTYELDISSFPGEDSILNGSDAYDFYYKDDFGIYGYEIASKTGTKLLDYTASNLMAEETVGMVPMGDGRFIGTAYDYESEENGVSIVVYSKVDPSTIANKKTITYGTPIISDNLRRAAMAFNKKNSDYKIEFKDYSKGEGSVDKMLADIVAGNIPDIIDISILPLSANQCVAKGLLEDLTPYFEKDSELNTGDIMDSVLETMQIDGKLYYVASGFYINSIVGKTKDVGTGTGWTFDELQALVEEKGEGVSLFYSGDSKSEMLEKLLGNGLGDFADWQTGECSFDSQDFKDILEFCNEKGINEEKEMSDAEMQEMVHSTPARLREGKVLLNTTDTFSMDLVQVDKQMFGEDITYIGYPNREKLGSYFQFNNQIGIYPKSEVKDKAWEFIRTFMTKEYQGTMMYSTPTRQDCFDLRVKAMTATKAYTDEFGQEIEPLEGSWMYGSVEMKKEPLSQEEVDMYVHLINNTKKCSGSDGVMMDIVLEEAKAYFDGKKSLDKTADIIQDRITTYVNESR